MAELTVNTCTRQRNHVSVEAVSQHADGTSPRVLPRVKKSGDSQSGDRQSSEANGDALNAEKKSLPNRAGLCLKPQHYTAILEEQPDVGWFEVHAENYLGAGGAPLHYLQKIRDNYPLSIHGVGLSIGSADGLDINHLKRVASLVERFQPESFSEHLAWSTHDNQFYSDLLPLPYNRQTEDIVCDHIDQIQSTLGRQMLLENPSNYLALEDTVYEEQAFIANVIRRTGCGLLLDVNNVYISAQNCGYSAERYIAQLPLQAVGEIHLAGHAVDGGLDSNSLADNESARDSDSNLGKVMPEPLFIDAHDREVCSNVWSLFASTIAQTGLKPSLIEWDTNIPEWPVFMNEQRLADLVLADHADVLAVSAES